jgi:hypothetical protein
MRAAVDARVRTAIRRLHRGLRRCMAPDLPIDTRTETQTDRQTGRQEGRQANQHQQTNTYKRPTCAHLYSVYTYIAHSFRSMGAKVGLSSLLSPLYLSSPAGTLGGEGGRARVVAAGGQESLTLSACRHVTSPCPVSWGTVRIFWE